MKIVKLVPYGVLPLTSLWLGAQKHWVHNSLSEVAAQPALYGWFVGWTLLCGVLYGYYVQRMEMLGLTYKTLRIQGYVLAFSLMMLGVLLPYAPKAYPILSEVHVALVMFAPTLLLALLWWFAFEQRMIHPLTQRMYHVLVGIMLMSGFLLLLFGKVSSLMEVSLALSLGIWLDCYSDIVDKLKK
ncbi:MAG: hypothetical protein ACRDBX_07365 [Erysipelotrichaceae bacterium]